MIEPMKKLSIFVKDIDRTTSLRELRKIGVMHLEETSVGSERAEELQQQFDQLSEICTRIEQTQSEVLKKSRHIIEEQMRVDEVLHKLGKLTRMIREEEELRQDIISCTGEIDRLSGWGDFSPEGLRKLDREGVPLKLYTVSRTYVDESLASDPQLRYIVLGRAGKYVRIAVIDSELEEQPEVQKFSLPRKSITQLQEQITYDNKRLAEIHESFLDEARFITSYRDVQEMILEELRFEAAHTSMVGNESVAWITGFVPDDSLQEVRALARTNAWGLIISEVSEEDHVPTKLKNNAFVRLIQPVFDLLGTVPGYREYDVSLFFLLFFSVFFAMIIGDAGYGLIFAGGAVAMHVKFGKMTEPVRLLYLLSGTTVVWGAVTGTWFGSDALLQSLPFLQALTIPQIASFPELFDMSLDQSQNTVMFICFLLAIMQLGLACLINFFRRFPTLKSYADLGWLAMLIGLYQVVLNLVIGAELAAWTLPTVITGFAVYVVFHEQERGVNFFKGLLKGIAGLFNTFLDSISAFSNIISYIRLFAVGMASLAIATSFNDMAEPLMGGWTIPAAVLILVLGHGLNLAMGVLSVVVHGVRLNMLEFSGQLGMEWTGTKYEPFREHLDSSLSDELVTTK